MNPRNIALIAVALGVAIGAGFMVNAYLGQQAALNQKKVEAALKVVPPTIPTARVLVAKKDLVVGTFVGREDLHWQEWPTESITPNYVTDGKGLVDAGKSEEKRVTIDDFIGSVVRLPIAAGQPMVTGLVARAGERGFLAAVLQPGMRAMSVPVNPTTGIAGFIMPGDHVDILWDVRSSSKGYQFTQTLFRDIRVIAIDQKTHANGATPAKLLTLELTPFQTEAMSLAQNMGGIEFTLRSIVPEEDSESILNDNLEDGLLARVGLGRSDGTEAGALLGADLLASASEEDREEISRDSWTVERDLLFGGKSTRRNRLVQQAPPPRPTGSGGTRKGSGAPVVVSSSGGSTRINIVRGTASQTIKVKK